MLTETKARTHARTALGIYIQVPFCQTKCTYCNFHTGVVSAGRFAPYVEAVCKEIRGWRKLYEGAGLECGSGKWRVTSGEREEGGASPSRARKRGFRGGAPNKRVTVDTVYIGGGTPSLLEPELLARMLEAVRETFATELGEVTLEADPETVAEEKARAWVAAGITRVSFGVQSFVDKELAAAGRMHRRADVYRALEILRAAGIGNVSFDLIAGLPWQTQESWKESLEELAKLGPEHVSVYLLEVDEGSRLGKELLGGGARYSARAVPSDDEMAKFYEMACAFLRAQGYRHYEISNWAKPGFESRHNLKYWEREPYLGFGAGAHSFSGKERWANAHDAAEYVRAMESGRLPIEQREVVTREMALEEELFLGLRKLEGIDVSRIARDYGVDVGKRFKEFEKAGLTEREGDVVRLAEGKLSVSNEVFVGLMK
ncbi:MAG TPA: radical SAM family heme chaperone HemW [Candidatus Angelobacter sp.]|nr:radical SAM family heme chaperone HemW [Candidatus Angelobacter sp.]